MCGITGIINPKIKEKEGAIREMTSRIFHRGPDEDGFFVDENVALGMRRLSIIDLSTGKQPVTSADGKLLIIFNGEIYNYKELRGELIKKGCIFKTNSDTEVILHMYEIFGDKMLLRLRGMFAFCIYNTEKKNVFLARDYFGIKPLYYYKYKESIVAFSSEIKSFFALKEFTPIVNDDAVYNYLSFQYNPLEETFFKSVYKLQPGHFMNIDIKNGITEIIKYWSYEIKQNNNLNELGTKNKILDVIKDSVEHHMIADVPVGSFLSGGIDSSIIATMMQKIRGEKKIKTFTVGFDTITEGVEASETSSFLGTDHTEIKISSKEYFGVLEKAVWHFDEPVADPSAIGLYFVAKEARKHVKVVLSGEGSDELFGGYNIYMEPFLRQKFSWLPKYIVKNIIKLRFNFPGKNFLIRLSQNLSDWYVGNALIFKSKEQNLLWKNSNLKKYSLTKLFETSKNLSESTQMQFIDINTWLIGDILAKADKMTMANSLELRVPFLDIEVSNLANTLPDKFKWRAAKTKYLLREAFKNIIPENTRNRRKLGFPVPIRDWFTADKKEIYDTILQNEYINKNMNVLHIENLIKQHITKKSDNARKIYLLLILALWYNTFILKQYKNI